MIEVGEYVRNYEGIIGKAIGRDIDNHLKLDNYYDGYKYLTHIEEKEDIVKHSKNIIDLIEEGDYVNGYRILEKTKIKNMEMQICILKDNNYSDWRTINEKTLKSIVTKEQFAQVEYRVEE